MSTTLTAAQVAAHLRYDPHTGDVVRVVGNPRCPVGSIAGTSDKRGYRYVSVMRRKLAAHRVAILLSTGSWPSGEVDHINGRPSDNRLCNLRVVDRVTNMQNRRSAQENNVSSGRLGVTWHRRAAKWQAQIKVGQKVRYLGLFADVDAADAAYLQAKREFHAGCTI